MRLLRNSRSVGQLRVLDVGCGAGGFVKIARHLGYQAEGIDPHLPPHCEDEGLWRATPDKLPTAAYDAVFLLNVAEHLVAPRRLLSDVRRLLRPGGVLFISCPYGESWALRMYGARWVHLALDEHLLFWTPGSLGRMLKSVGFTGNSSIRIGGSPFPFGRVASSKPSEDTVIGHPVCNPETAHQSFQARVWRFARWLQARETSGNLVRAIVNATRLGDYLEYAICLSGSHEA